MRFNLETTSVDQLLKNDMILIKGGAVNPATCNPTGDKNPGCSTNDSCPVNNNVGCGCTVNNQTTCAARLR